MLHKEKVEQFVMLCVCHVWCPLVRALKLEADGAEEGRVRVCLSNPGLPTTATHSDPQKTKEQIALFQ